MDDVVGSSSTVTKGKKMEDEEEKRSFNAQQFRVFFFIFERLQIIVSFYPKFHSDAVLDFIIVLALTAAACE